MQPAALHRFFKSLAEAEESAVLLGGSPEINTLNEWAIIGLRPCQTLTLQGNRLAINGQVETVTAADALFEKLEAAFQKSKGWEREKREGRLPFGGGLCGVFGYEFYPWCDSAWSPELLLKDALPQAETPAMILFEFSDWLLIRLRDARLFVLSESQQRAETYCTHWQACLTAAADGASRTLDIPEADADYLETFRTSFDKPHFEEAANRLKQAIYDGEIYQANLSMRFEKTVSLDPHAFYETVCKRNPSPFAAFFKYPGGMILSNSPERLIRMDDAGKLETRPMAGTRGRGKTTEEDEAIGAQLLANEKERAEHLMLVDLARNDLGRVSAAGSVDVDELMVLERYSHVTHVVSNVAGQRRTDAIRWDILKALFPGGTITGCPKIRCINLLHDTEPVPRGFYTGSLGYLDRTHGALDFNILIRSLYLSDSAEPLRYNAAIHAGAGIVHDSVAAHEYRECLRKAGALLSVLKASES